MLLVLVWSVFVAATYSVPRQEPEHNEPIAAQTASADDGNLAAWGKVLASLPSLPFLPSLAEDELLYGGDGALLKPFDESVEISRQPLPVANSESTSPDLSVETLRPQSGESSAPLPQKLPMLAIVIDDCGFNLNMAKEVMALKLPVTFAIIPNLRHSLSTAEMFVSNDVPFLVHVPMQAFADPDGKAGKGGYYSIGVGMEEKMIRDVLISQIESLPGAFGINNHRGSKATSDARTMEAVMKVLRERGMLFMDSSTSARSVGYKTALSMNLRAAKNNFFLDNESDREKIAQQAMRAIKITAKKEQTGQTGQKGQKGRAVAICHLRPETIAYLKTVSPERIRTEYGVDLVTLPDLMRYAEPAGLP